MSADVICLRTRQRIDGRHLALVTGEEPDEGPTIAELDRAMFNALREGDQERAETFRKARLIRLRRAQRDAFPPDGAA